MSAEAHTYDEFIKGGLQAVIIAESFQNKFKPVSHEKLKCLFPLANAPMLHYVIEFLLMNKVTEIFIAVCIHRSQIDKFLNAQKYKGVKINVITLESSSNFGDALREINQLQTIKHEFILCRGDIITNVNIHQAIREHFKVKAEDKEKKLVLTKLFVKVPFSNPIRNKQQDIALILDDQTKEILKYESFQNNKSLKINEEYIPLKLAAKKYQIRFDLVDSEISICSRDVLNYFTDNFDYESLCDEFINQIQSSEIIEDRIMAYELSGYFARILDPRTYSEVTQDILSRYLHPMVVDSKLLFPNNNYHFNSFNKYLDKDVSLGFSSNISNNCQIGKSSKIGNYTQIERSTIGKDCHIGNNVTIKNSYIWNNVKIHDGCVIENAIICDKVELKKGVNIQSGSIISFGIIVNENQTVQKGQMISKFTYNSKTLKFEESEDGSSDLFEVGCVSYLPRECQLKEDELIGSKFNYDDEESDFEDEDEDQADQKSSEVFLNETRKTIERTNKDQISNAITEIKSLKMSYNKDQADCVEAIIPSLLDKVTEQNLGQRSKDLQELITNWKDLLVEFMKGGSIDEKEYIQSTLIRAIEIYCGTHDLYNNTFHVICQILYKEDLILAERFIKWNEQAEKSIKNRGNEDEIQDDIFDFIDASKRVKFIKDMSKFIDYLKTAAEEQEEEEGEEEYDEEEEGADEEEEDEEDQ